MKRRIFLVCLTVFLRLQIYEAIAAIFWQSASYVVINSRAAIAGAIIGLHLVFFLRHDFCYDHMTSQPLFVHSFMQFQLNCMRDVIFRS